MPTSNSPLLYSFRRCPFAIRARLALAVSGTPYELREVQLRAKPAAMLAISPKGTVPVLLIGDGQVIDQSLDIMRWALQRNDPEGWLARDDRELLALADGSFKQDLDAYKYAERNGDEARTSRQRGATFLRELETRLWSGGQLCGTRRGLTDAAILPFVRQYAAVDPAWFGAQPLPHLQAWLEHHVESDLFKLVMKKEELSPAARAPEVVLDQ